MSYDAFLICISYLQPLRLLWFLSNADTLVTALLKVLNGIAGIKSMCSSFWRDVFIGE